MRNARVTVLMTDAEKAGIEADAARLGVSSGEFIRLAVNNFEKPTAAEEAELTALVREMNVALPKIEAALKKSSKVLQDLHRENDAFFKERGIR